MSGVILRVRALSSSPRSLYAAWKMMLTELLLSTNILFSRQFATTNSGLPFSRQVIGAVVAQLFWLCMKAVLSFIAKDVVAKGLDHDTFVLSIREIKRKKLDTELVRSQLRGDFLLGRDQADDLDETSHCMNIFPMGVYEYSISTYSVPIFSRNRMIDSPNRFEDDAWTVIWLFPGSELDMRGDRFSIFGEFRSVCKIWTNSYGTIYRDRKNHLRLSLLDYPPRHLVENFLAFRNSQGRSRDAKDDQIKSAAMDIDKIVEAEIGLYMKSRQKEVNRTWWQPPLRLDSWKHVQSWFRDNLEECGDFGVFWSLLSAKLHGRVRCLAMDGDFPTIRMSPYVDTRYSFELDFQCRQFKVNQHPVAEVMPILLKSGQSASRKEDVEEMKDCRSTVHPCHRSTVMPEQSLIDTLVIASIDAVAIASIDARSWFRDNLEECGDFGVFWSLLSAKLHGRVRCLAMDGDLPTIRLSPYVDTRYRFELDFQCRQFGVNQHPVAEVMPILLKSGQSASREEAVEEMKDCRSTVHPCHRSTVMPERGLSIFYDRLKPRSNHKLSEYPWTT
ncbi:hypothetical protein F2Q69_00059727 [Brassica cretica]|uniref:Uncharacterized protein n=1 Tax=Brassica cretica TaxID=69181 RepID=A0A8S9RPR9_BRACR|nr:hypothetical protein F2Q69_00059727 [Brassica cretica]